MDEIWNQRPDENPKQYTAFWDYCTMGTGRSLGKLHAEYSRQSEGKSLAKPPTTRLPTLESWSSQYGWLERAAAWDLNEVALRKEAAEKRRQEIIEREALHAEWQLERWEQAWANTPFHEQDVVQEIPDPDNPGAMMRVVVVRSNIAKMQQFTRWRRDISEQQRRAAGMPEKITESKTEHSGSVTQITMDWRQAILLERQNQQKKADALPEPAKADDDEPAAW